ncbi:MAG: hypothetical protein E7576_07190 [Ruminococcaceae bacterium]|jgi:DNA-directed RNA polymerase subunit RPC12/RpoP|nr:hypothetical protein [Oscillospiraceae bacterium]
MINLIKLECPHCGANLEVKDDVRQCFCTYCGMKIVIDNNNEHIIRTIDEGQIREAELQYKLRILEIKEAKERESRERKVKLIAGISLGTLMLLSIIAGIICYTIAKNSYDNDNPLYGLGILFLIIIPCTCFIILLRVIFGVANK